MTATLPFLTAYDPPGSSEGSLDPMGLYQIADQLAVQLVPAVRERMQRIRFLSAMAVGALVTEGLAATPARPDDTPALVWEWLLVEAIVREAPVDPSMWGIPGTLVARRALASHGYLDARSYLKTPRIFGFHGVYKRLGVHLGILDVHLATGPAAELVATAWAKGQGYASMDAARPLLAKWTAAVKRSLDEKVPRTKANWSSTDWATLAAAFLPRGAKAAERRALRNLLLEANAERLGALPAIWGLVPDMDATSFTDAALHRRLRISHPHYLPLLTAITEYETFARHLQDAFDCLRRVASYAESRGFPVATIAQNDDFVRCGAAIAGAFDSAHRALAESGPEGGMRAHLLQQRFGRFGEPLTAAALAWALCEHHEEVQRAKSLEGKRSWFDRLGGDRIHVRHAYRQVPDPGSSDRYVHEYRGLPIRRFYEDLQ